MYEDIIMQHNIVTISNVYIPSSMWSSCKTHATNYILNNDSHNKEIIWIIINEIFNLQKYSVTQYSASIVSEICLNTNMYTLDMNRSEGTICGNYTPLPDFINITSTQMINLRNEFITEGFYGVDALIGSSLPHVCAALDECKRLENTPLHEEFFNKFNYNTWLEGYNAKK